LQALDMEYSMGCLPTGTVTFLFTEIEAGGALWDAQPVAMASAADRHNVLIRCAVEQNSGSVFKTVADGFCAVFSKASDGLAAALDAQLALALELWPEHAAIKVKMALHTGASEPRDGDYFGPPLNRVARLLSAGHGGQVLITRATHELCSEGLRSTIALKPLGEHRLRDLSRPETVFQLLHPELPSEFPRLASLDNPGLRNNLFEQPTSFVGRDREMAEITAGLRKTRLLTLTGAGGSGKTRLSLQAAAEVLQDYRGGTWLVELAPLSEAALVLPAVMRVLGIEEQPGQSLESTLIEALTTRKTLLLLDNCEHLLAECARLVGLLLRKCPDVTLLATSRERLGVAGESVFMVPPLAMPDPRQPITVEALPRYEAARLFIERATQHRSDFTVTTRNAPALVQLCHRLDGIPLAIELAAARVRALSVEQINDRLDSRFRLLTGGDRSALPRQQTLRALIDWGYDLLDDREKRLFGRLSVFSGGWTLEAAESVAADETDVGDWEVLDLLASLSDKSIVVADERDGATRYRMLESLRQYASERLEESGEKTALNQRYAAYFVELAERSATRLAGPDQVKALDQLESEHDNLRSALHTCTADNLDARTALRLAGALQQFWHSRGYVSDGREWFGRALSLPDAPNSTSARARALLGAGLLARDQGDYEPAIASYDEALRLYRVLGDSSGEARAVVSLGTIAYCKGEYDLASARFAEGLDTYRRVGDRHGVANALAELASVALAQSDYDLARTLLEESVALSRELGDSWSVGMALGSLASVAKDQGDHLLARSLYEEALRISRDLGARGGIYRCLGNLGNLAYAQQDYSTARSLYEDALTMCRELGDKRGVAMSLGNLGGVCLDLGDHDAARALYDESLEIDRALGDKQGVAYDLSNLGLVAFRVGDYVSARSLYRESLALRLGMDDQRGTATLLESFAGLEAQLGRTRPATRLWAAADALRRSIGSPMPANDRAEYDRMVALARAAVSDEAFAADWAAGQALTVEQAASEAMETGESAG
jgi:predicted ATPase/class 3 adenylate cyclase/Tfp pilus assembly protein PilF